MGTLFLAALFALRVHAENMAGDYDLGPRAAAMRLRQDVDQAGQVSGLLTFCHRETLLNQNRCTGQARPIRCRVGTSWICEEGGTYPFRAEISPLTPETVRYLFRSSFNEGDLVGTRL